MIIGQNPPDRIGKMVFQNFCQAGFIIGSFSWELNWNKHFFKKCFLYFSRKWVELDIFFEKVKFKQYKLPHFTRKGEPSDFGHKYVFFYFFSFLFCIFTHILALMPQRVQILAFWQFSTKNILIGEFKKY